MENCCNNCQRPGLVTDKDLEYFKKALEEMGQKNASQDESITKLFNMYRCEVAASVAAYMDVMKESGELNELLAQMEESLKPYYTGIETEHLRDTATGTDYYVTVVPAKDKEGKPMRWHLGIANDAYDGVGLEGTMDFAARKSATIAINAGVFNIDTGAPIGTVIKDGRVVASAVPGDAKYQYLAIFGNGSFGVYPQETTAGKMLADGVVDACTIFTTLLKNGSFTTQTDDRDEPRQAIGVRADGSVVIVTTDGRKPGEDAGVSYSELAMLMAKHGAVNAWALDGGGSASTVLRGVKQNDDIDHFKTDRPVNTFLYIAKDTTMDQDNNTGPDLGKVKQQLMEKIMEKLDFWAGYIRLRGPENYFAPGIEMYVNAEDKRRSKLGLTIDPATERNSYAYWNFRAGETEANNLLRIYGHGVYMQTYHGPSSDRPNGPIGLVFFDESLNKPIWRSANGWVDATGTAV